MSATVSVRSFYPLLIFARTSGHDPSVMLADAGLTAAMLGQTDLRLPFETFNHAFARTAARLNEPLLGLRAAEAVDFRMFGAFAQPSDFTAFQLMVTSPTVAAALAAVVPALPIAYGSLRWSFECENGSGVVRYEPAEGTAPVVTEHIIALIVLALRCVAAGPFAPNEVVFPHDARADVNEYIRRLSTSVRFGAPHAGFRVAAEDMSLALATADAVIHEALTHRVARTLREISSNDLVEGVREVVLRELPDGNHLAANVAAQLGISARTLARHLAAKGTTHRAIVDEMRMRLTARYLREGRPITEVACLVGFSAHTAFLRAFRRWYGCSPAEWLPPSRG